MNDQQQKFPFVYRIEDTVDCATAARIAQVSSETVRRWCDLGLIPAYKLVGRWRINRAQFIEWLEELQRGR